jgi:hypothetical protein
MRDAWRIAQYKLPKVTGEGMIARTKISHEKSIKRGSVKATIESIIESPSAREIISVHQRQSAVSQSDDAEASIPGGSAFFCVFFPKNHPCLPVYHSVIVGENRRVPTRWELRSFSSPSHLTQARHAHPTFALSLCRFVFVDR